MRSLVRLLLLCVIVLAWASGAPVRAAAPYGWVRSSDGRFFAWNNSRPIPFSIDQGPLGSLSNADAVGLVQTAFQRWHNVPTASISFVQAAPLAQDITGANVLAFLNNLPPGISVILDTDGSVLRALGLDPTLAVALGKPVGSDPGTGTITSGFVVLNGLFLDGRFNPDDLTLADFRGQVVQAIGRVLGLGSSQLNTELILDGIPDNNRLVPQMDPVAVPGKGDQLTVDDQAALALLYPNSTLVATTGTIRGQVLLPDGVTGLQGINVIARRVVDGAVTAVSAISGMRYKNQIGPPGMNGSRQIALRGAYELVGLPPGTYAITFEALLPESLAGPLQPPQFLPGGTRYFRFPGISTPDPNAAGVVTVSPGQVVENINLLVGDAGAPPPQDINEQKPNQFPEQAQTLSPPVRVHGSVQPGDPSGVTVPGPPVPGGAPGSATAPVHALFRLTLAQPTLVTATLSAGNAASDLNLYLLSGPVATSPRVVAVSADPGTPPESFQLRLLAGVYFLGVSLASGPGTTYTLEVNGTAAPDVAAPAPPKPRLNNLVVANVVLSGADAFFISDQPTNTIFYTSNPLTESSNPTLTTQHHQLIANLAPGIGYRLRTLGVAQGAPPATTAGGPGTGTLPDVFFTTALPALAGGVGQIYAGVSDLIPDPDDPNAVFVVLSFRNVGGGDASAVVINSLAASPGWSFSNPLPMPLGLGFVGRSGSGIIMTRVVRSGAPPDSAPVLSGSGTYATPGGQQTFNFGAPVSSLILTKAADPSSARPGDVVTFTLTVTNRGQGAATGVVISDALPAGMTFVAPPQGAQFQNGTFSWSLATLTAGGTATVSFQARVAGTTASGTTITNVAQVQSNEVPTPTASNQGAPVVVTVASPPQLQVRKTADRTTVQVGQVINYTITVVNLGPGQATNVQIIDDVPAGTFYPPSPSATRLSWSVGLLPAGNSATVSFPAQVANSVTNGNTISNLAQASSAETPALVPSNQGTPVNVTVVAPPALTLSKSVDSLTTRPGQPLNYTITVRNTGGGPATNVQITDPVPNGTGVSNISAGGAFTDPNSTTIGWSLGTLAAGDSATVSFTAQVDNNVANGTTITNVAQVRSAEITTPVSSNQGTPVSVTVNAPTPPVLALTKSVDAGTARPGQMLNYTLTASNTGSGQATNLQITDVIPDGTVFQSANPGAGFLDARTLSWSFGTLAAGTSVTVTFQVQVAGSAANGTSIRNVAQVRSAEVTTPVSSNQGSPVVTTVVAPPTLMLTKQADRQTVAPGGTINYTLIASNQGPGQATTVQVTDDFPAGTFYPPSPNARRIFWNLGTMAAGASVTLSFQVQVGNGAANGSTISNLAQITSAEVPGGVPSNQGSPTVTTVFAPPTLSLTKQVDRQTAGPGDLITYTLNYSNAGPGQATGLQLTDNLPTNTTFASAPGGSFNGRSVVWNLGTLPAGTSDSRTLQVRVASSLSSQVSISNTAQLTAQEVTTPVLSNQGTPVVFTAIPLPQLALSKQADRQTVFPGGTITYTLNYSVTAAAATNVTIQDQLPANTSFAGASNNGTTVGNSVVWNIGTVPAGQNRTLTLQLKVDPNAPVGARIDNTAQITSNEVPGGRQSGVASVTITAPARLTLQKVANVTSVSPGSAINFQMTVTNGGGSPANNVVLSDPVPAGTTASAATSGNNFNPTSNVISWSISSLNPGASRSFTLIVRVNNDAAATITNTAQVTSPDIAAPVSASANVTVNVPLNLTISKTVDKPTAAPGDELRYDINYKNNSSAPVNGVTLTDTLPPGVQIIAVSPPVTPQVTAAGTTLTWNLGTLGANQPGSTSVRVRIDSTAANGAQIRNRATIAVPAQQYAQNSEAVTTVMIAPVVLTLRKDVDKTTAAPGDTLIYTLAYQNPSVHSLTGVRIADPLPQNVTFKPTPNGGQLVGNEVRFDFPSMMAGAMGTVSFQVTVNAGVANNTPIQNQAHMTAAGVSQVFDSNLVTTTVSVGTPPPPPPPATVAGTWSTLPASGPPPAGRQVSLTADKDGRFTVWALSQDRSTIAASAQGRLNANGTFNAASADGAVQFSGHITADGRTAEIEAQGPGLSFTLQAPRRPDVISLPDSFVGTFTGFGAAANGDRINVQCSIDPGGNATLSAAVIRAGTPSRLLLQFGTFQVNANGQLVDPNGGGTVGLLQVRVNSLALVYSFQQNTFQVTLQRVQ